MIIVKCPHVKMANGTDVQKYYDELIEMLDLTCLVCEDCRQCGFSVHAYYTRMFTDDGMDPVDILILRIVCNSCGKTHAILPSFIVPYRRHSLNDHIRVITAAEFSGLQDMFNRMIIASKEEYYAIRRQFRLHWKQRLLSEQIEFDPFLFERCINTYKRQFMQIHCTPCLLYHTTT